MTMNITEQVEKAAKYIKTPDQILGKGTMMPFNGSNSSSRKLMQSVQLEHALPLIYSEVPLIGTGWENEFGRTSSSIKKSDGDYIVLNKISKYPDMPDKKYLLILYNEATNYYTIVERSQYYHTTESYGYLYDNSLLDKLGQFSKIEKDTIIQKSTSFDEYNNREDGVNLRTLYLSLNMNMEDSIIISETAADKLISPLIKTVQIVINTNDILLDMYGNKSFPDIGEHVEGGILAALRRERKEESLFTQSAYRLNNTMISDEKFMVEGEVIDIDVFCNDPTLITTSHYNNQLKKYYQLELNYSNTIVRILDPIINDPTARHSYELEDLYFYHKRIVDGNLFMKDKPFSNTILEITLLERNKISIGDKLSNRYGGKGVVSEIRKDDNMPQLDNGERAELLFNAATCINRLNPGQLLETSLTHIGSRLLEYIDNKATDSTEAINMYLDFIRLASPNQYDYINNIYRNMSADTQSEFLKSMSNDAGIYLSISPVSEEMSIDIINNIYKHFGHIIDQYTVSMPIIDSNGNIRFADARRKLVCGKEYIYRLKQYAEEKFSATSLSYTNLRNENTKSRTAKTYKTLHARTPVRFGNMETGNMLHLKAETVIENLMLHSASPLARRMVDELMTGDPFKPYIDLTKDAKNRNVEMLEAYLHTMGYRLIFERKLKEYKPIFKKYVKVPKPKKIFYDLRVDEDPTIPKYNSKGEKVIFKKEIFKELDYKYELVPIDPNEKVDDK